MNDMSYLTLAYLGMIGAIALWTWTVFSRSNKLERKIAALERILEIDSTENSEDEDVAVEISVNPEVLSDVSD